MWGQNNKQIYLLTFLHAFVVLCAISLALACILQASAALRTSRTLKNAGPIVLVAA
jgi:hypothetical protein